MKNLIQISKMTKKEIVEEIIYFWKESSWSKEGEEYLEILLDQLQVKSSI